MVFSPDSQRIAYKAVRPRWLAGWVFGESGCLLSGLNWLGFFYIVWAEWPLWAGVVWLATFFELEEWLSQGGKLRPVLDGLEGKEYDAGLGDSKLVFDGPSSLQTLVRRGAEIFRVELEVNGT